MEIIGILNFAITDIQQTLDEEPNLYQPFAEQIETVLRDMKALEQALGKQPDSESDNSGWMFDKVCRR
jgi:hypothetical protein